MNNTKSINGFTLSGNSDGNSIQVSAENALNCPFCHVDIDTQPLVYFRTSETEVQVFLKCKRCKNSFIGYYFKNPSNGIYQLKELTKGNKKFTEFNKEIEDLSPNFIKIYSESECAEQEKLNEICGIGYRKSLEFLIKDFLISRQPDKTEDIKAKFLSNCIKEYLEDERIKGIAERATWLGNDETHYNRIWENNDISDLKKMIAILINYIEKELLTDAYLKEMDKTTTSQQTSS
ncbi:DUF4145 domain-containing protein [Candidatus Dependentiae bacterium]|nr:DUF4145 domain-containing protein [Candidatus Dependentiae bacterium]